MAAACSVSPFLPELLQVTIPRRDTWDISAHFLPVLLWFILATCTILPYLLQWSRLLQSTISLWRIRVMSVWFFLLFTSVPYAQALSHGLSVQWVPLPSPRSASSPARFSQDGWGTDLGLPTTPPVSVQERLRRESTFGVRAFVASQAFDNNLIAKYHLED